MSAPNRLTMAQALNQALAQEMERDPRVLIYGEDVGLDGGVFRVTDGLIQKFGADRVIDTPLAESGIIGTAIGLAIGGFVPVTEIQFMGFIYVCMNQIAAHAARFRNRTRGRFSIPLVIRTPHGGGIHPPEHHSEAYESLFINTPGIKVVIPSNAYDAKGLLTAAIRDPDPVLFLEPIRIYRAFKEEIPAESYTVEIGKAKVVHEGRDLTVVSYGAMVHVANEAREVLDREGVKLEIIDLRTLNPLDLDTVLASVRKTGRALVLHEAPRNCGLGAEIAALIQERAILHLHAPVARVAGYDIAFPYAQLEHLYLPHRERVVKKIRDVLAF